MTVSNALCKFVEKQFNYPSEDWDYEHVRTTLQEVLEPQYLTDTMQGDKEVDTYTYYTMNNDQDHVYPFIISTMEETIALGYIQDAHMVLLYLYDGQETIIDQLQLLNLNKEMIQDETVD